jgi:isoquinoline 1-oxidoreductase subunit alpha
VKASYQEPMIIREAWITEEVPQCNSCRSDQLVAILRLLLHTPSPTDDQIVQALIGVCQCVPSRFPSP